MKKRIKTTSGFNLVEMSIALVVVAIGIMSVAAIFPDQLEAVRQTADRAQMGQFAQSVDGVLRAIGAAGQDLGAIPGVPAIPAGSIALPPLGGGIWTANPNGGGASPPAPITLDINNSAITGTGLPTADPAKGGGLLFVDITDGNYVNQSLWYHIHIQPLPATDADGHRVVIYTWRSDGVTAPPAATPVAQQYITEIYKF